MHPTHRIIASPENSSEKYTYYAYSDEELDNLKTIIKNNSMKIKHIETLERDIPEEGCCGEIRKKPCTDIFDHRCMVCTWLPNTPH